jgi:prophage antirepressor-like protein
VQPVTRWIGVFFFFPDMELVMENSLVCISGVRGYEKDGVAYLHIEDVARGLGFERTELKNDVEYKSIRWERVEGFLNELNFRPQVGENENPHDYYIPENIFYRLCMKARNEVAEAFQAKVADDIIPSIRKTGKYEAHPVVPSYMLKSEEERALAWAEEHRQARLALEAKEREIKSLQAQKDVLRQDYMSNKDFCQMLIAKGVAVQKSGKPYALSTLKTKMSPILQTVSHTFGYSISEETVVVDGVERKTPFYHRDVCSMIAAVATPQWLAKPDTNIVTDNI